MRTIGFLLLVLFGIGCGQPPVEGLTGEGAVKKVVSKTNGYHYLVFAITGDLFIRTANEYMVNIEAQENIAANIVQEVKGDTLVIRFDKPVRRADKIKTLVQLPAFLGLDLNGSGNAFIEDAHENSALVLRVNGSGNIETAKTLKAQLIEAVVSGSGNIRLKGSATRVDCTITGSGNIDAPNLKAKDVSANITGTGNMTVQATETLTVDLTGSGNVYYKGKPNIQKQVTGTGDVRPY